MQITPLCAVPELADQVRDLIRDVWPEYYVTGPGDAQADIAARTRASGLPFGLVGVDQGQVIGTVALTGPSFGSIAGEDVWVGGLAVTPDARGRGHASALVRHMTDHARAAGIATLYTTTADARGVFLRQGWTELRKVHGDQGQWRVLHKALSACVVPIGDEKI